MPDNVALFATVILLLPMGYFLLAAPAFLLVRLDIPSVAMLLRIMFNGYFLALITTGVIGTHRRRRGGPSPACHGHWPGNGFCILVTALVFAANGRPAARCRRCRGRAWAA